MSVSVVVPNFNHGKLLIRAILALMAQRSPPSEIIIIDDASTDDSLEIAARLQKRFPCIRLIRHEQNRGTVAGLNEGLHAATQELIYFGAADDYTFPNFLFLAEQSLAAYSAAAFFCARVVIVDPAGRILGYRPFMWPSPHPALPRPGLPQPDTDCSVERDREWLCRAAGRQYRSVPFPRLHSAPSAPSGPARLAGNERRLAR